MGGRAKESRSIGKIRSATNFNPLAWKSHACGVLANDTVCFSKTVAHSVFAFVDAFSV